MENKKVNKFIEEEFHSGEENKNSYVYSKTFMLYGESLFPLSKPLQTESYILKIIFFFFLPIIFRLFVFK